MFQVAWFAQLIFLTRLLTIFICLGLASCASIQKPHSPVITVTDNTGERFEFSGKGAGAGMMMAGSMGAMGIAIGVAIDVGIAKDIRDALVQDHPDWFNKLSGNVRSRIVSQCAALDEGVTAELCQSERIDVSIEKIAFKIVEHADDMTAVVVGLKVADRAEFEKEQSIESQISSELEQLKSNGKQVWQLLESSVTELKIVESAGQSGSTSETSY